jgi:F-type H+-transporting ATPase subunit b
MTPPDYTVFIQIANFLVLLFVLNIIAYRPIRKIIQQRNEEITSFENITEDWTQKAEKSAQELGTHEAVTRKEGLKEKEVLKNKGLEDERNMLYEAYSSTEENLEKARQEIQERLKRAQQSLQAEVDDFSQELAKKILGRAV